MKVSGFTFLRNAEINGYPFIESIHSILPIVDEFVCAIGPSDDDTKSKVQALNNKKIRIIETRWNENMRDRGFVYGQQKMVAQYNCSGDWAFYLEADEVLHEKEYPLIQDAMQQHVDNPDVEALYFDFHHFYGTANQVGIAGYRKAPRIIRNTIRTIAPDGLFWVVLDKNKQGRYPKAVSAGAHIYHYGHCRNIAKMDEKLKRVGKYWGSKHESFEGYGHIDLAEIKPFHGAHPKIMDWWLENEAEKTFHQDPDFKPSRRDIRNRVRFAIERAFDIEISKKHFKALD